MKHRPGDRATTRHLQLLGHGEPVVDFVPTGFPSLDRLLGGGLRHGDLVALCGDVGSGKSALALAIALRATRAGNQTLVLTSEMAPDRVLERALAIDGKLSVDQLRSGAFDAPARVALARTSDELSKRLPLISSPHREGPRDVVIALQSEDEIELVIVDSLTGLSRSMASRDDEQQWVVRELKELAADQGVALLVTVPPSGSVRGRTDPRPTLDDAGAAGAMKHEADVVLGLFREEMYQPSRGIEGAAELHLLKNRNGGTGYVDLYFYQQWMRFEDMVE